MARSTYIGFTVSVLVVLLSGCTSWREYYQNGFKVGPNYCEAPAATAEHWIDEPELKSTPDPEVLKHWWTIFNDPKLNDLVICAYSQNLSLKQAGFRILQARANRAVAVGNIFPQSQGASGNFNRTASQGSNFYDSWNSGFSLKWELDFWGQFRRAVAAADANLDASIYSYDYVLVTLLGDVAYNYVTVRTTQERIRLLKSNAELQQGILDYINKRLSVGKQLKLDSDQALSNLRQTEAAIPQHEITLRQAENSLCILMGIPPEDLSKQLGDGPIPSCPPDVVVGIPADLVRRRPDVRKAERVAASQAEQIGIAQANLYPAFSINGTFGYAASNFQDLFQPDSLTGNVGPSFQWNLLNYGRIVNNVRAQEASFQALVTEYQNTVLTANKEVENGLVTFLRAQRRSKLLDESVTAAESAVKIVVAQYKFGAVDFNRYATIEQNLVTQQDSSAQARGQIAQGLIDVYRALGGGWELKFEGEAAVEGGAAPMPPALEQVPMPNPPGAPQPPTPDEKTNAAPGKTAPEKAAKPAEPVQPKAPGPAADGTAKEDEVPQEPAQHINDAHRLPAVDKEAPQAEPRKLPDTPEPPPMATAPMPPTD